MKKSAFKMGWLMVMFDLPVTTKPERKEASNFRKELMKKGYQMIQFSVYARACVTADKMARETNKLNMIIPSGGNVRALFFTDHQWKNAITVIGKDYRKKHNQKNPDMPEQLEFW